MLIKIIEQDIDYLRSFTAFLVERHGAQILSERILEVEDDFDMDMYHGIGPVSAEVEGTVPEDVRSFLTGYRGSFEFYLSLKSQLQEKGSLSQKQIDAVRRAIEREKPVASSGSVPEDVQKFLTSYKGSFEFYLSLKSQMESKGSLSEKQVAAVRRAIERETPAPVAAPAVQSAGKITIRSEAAPVRQFSVAVGEVLILSKFIARKVAEAAGYTKPHYAVEVVAVHAETDKALMLTMRLTAQRTTHCCCCGATLTDAASVAAGIGPICANKYGGGSLGGVEDAIRQTIEVKQWIPKKSIKERAQKASE